MSSQEDRFQKEEEDQRDLVSKVRDLHLIYKELRSRHGINFDPGAKDRAHKLVYFSKVRSQFLKNPDLQQKYRKEIVEKIGEVPTPEPLHLYPDYLQLEFEKTTVDLTSPKNLRGHLARFFRKRVKWLRLYRGKVLARWGFTCRGAAEAEQANIEMNYVLGKLQQEADMALQRVSRLETDEDFGLSVTRPTPITQEGTSLFSLLPPVAYSNIAEDDIEVSLRVDTYHSKCRRAMRRAISGLQWLWLQERHSIWSLSQELLQIEKAVSISRMRQLTADEDFAKEDVKVSVYTNINLKNIKRQLAIMEKVKAVHSTFAELQYNKNDMLLNSHKDDFDQPPKILDNISQLQMCTTLLAPKYNLIGDLSTDDGHSLAYQVSLLFPRHFGFQKQRFELSVYDAKPEEKDLPVIRYANLLALKLNVISMKPATGEQEQEAPVKEAVSFKIVRVKKADWLECVQMYPRPCATQVRQDTRLSHMQFIDKLLKNAFEVLEVQDLPTINKTLELFSQDYHDMASKRGFLLIETGTKASDSRFKFFSDLLKKTAQSQETGQEDTFSIPSMSLKSLYSLMLLEARTHKLGIYDVLNVFRSIQRRVSYDLLDLKSGGNSVFDDKEVIPPGDREQEVNLEPKLEEGLGGLRIKEGETARTVAATCPILPSIHSLYAKACNKERFSLANLVGRRDILEISKEEVLVKDDAGVYIQYDVVRNDYEELEAELLRLGSFYIEKYENFYANSVEPRPAIDRDALRNELLEHEFRFQKAKLKLLLVYLDVYDHLVTQKAVSLFAQHIVDLMSLRPRFNLHASYFIESYRLHIKSLKSQKQLLRSLANHQIRKEREIASILQEEQHRILREFASKEALIDPEVLTPAAEPSSVVPLEDQFRQELWFQKLDEGWPLRVSHVHTVADLGFKSKYNALDVFSSLEEVVPALETMKRNLQELELIHATENPVSMTAMEAAAWTLALPLMQRLLDDSDYAIEAGNVFDSPGIGFMCVKELIGEVNPTHPRLLKDSLGAPDVPSQLQLVCNLWECYRLKEQLRESVDHTRFFMRIYRTQREAIKKEGGIEMSEPAKFDTEIRPQATIDEGPGSKESFPLSATEFDPRLKAFLHFSNKDAVKTLLLPSGLQDLRAVTQYEKMQEQLLLIAVQINQFALDSYQKQMAEIDLARRCNYISKNSIVNWKNVLGRKGEGFDEEQAGNEEKRLLSRAIASSGKLFFDINAVKANGRFSLAETFQKRLSQVPKDALTCRYLRASLVKGYCLDTLRIAYNESVKIQLLRATLQVNERLKIAPPSETVFVQGSMENSESGLLTSSGALNNLMYVPSPEEILSLRALTEDDRRKWEPWSPYTEEQGEPDTEELPTLFTRLSRWRYVGRPRLMLEALCCTLQIFDFQLFTNLLGCPAVEVLAMQDAIREGSEFWEAEEKREIEEITDEAANKLLSQQTSQNAVAEEVKRTLLNFKQTASQVTGSTKEKLQTLLGLAQRERGMFYFLLYQGTNYCLMHDNEFGAVQFQNLLIDAANLPRGRIRIHGRVESDLETLLSKTVVQVKKLAFSYPFVPPVHRFPLETGLMLLQQQTRTYCLAIQTGLQLKLDDQRVHKQLMKSSNLLDVLALENYHVQIELQTLRLKWAWMVVMNGKGLITSAEEYDSLLNLYRDQLEWKIDYAMDRPESLAERETNKLKAEIYLLKSEFHKMFCKISISHLETEVAGLSSALESPSEYSIKEYATSEPSGNKLDMSRKVGVLHQFLNSLRNRCSTVETPMSGKALVFSLRDMTLIVKRFCSNLLRWGNDELRLRSEVSGVQIRSMNHALYIKEQQLRGAQHSLSLMKEHFDKLVNAQLSQKGNQLIYELDTANRQLKELKDNYGSLEQHLKELTYQQFEDRLSQANQRYSSLQQQFREYRNGVTVELSTEISNERKHILGRLNERQTTKEDIEKLQQDDDAKREAKEERELVKLHEVIRKMRTFHQWSRLYLKERFEQQVQELKDRLSSNQYLLEQLSELQRREALLKQELAYTQQALAASEKLADKMQSQIEEMNNQRLRLQQYKTSKGQRLVELETKVKQFQKSEQLDQSKLLAQVVSQNKQLMRLKQAELNSDKLVYQERIKRQVDMAKLSRKLKAEGELKNMAFQKLDTFREEMHGNDQDPNSLAAIWRNRCEDLLEEMKQLRGQNGQMRERLVSTGQQAFLEQFPALDQRPESAYDYMTSFSSRRPESQSQIRSLRASSLNR